MGRIGGTVGVCRVHDVFWKTKSIGAISRAHKLERSFGARSIVKLLAAVAIFFTAMAWASFCHGG